MNTESAFIAERPLAQHCPELVKVEPDPADLLPLLSGMGERLVRQLPGALAPLLGGVGPSVRCSSASTGTIATIRDAAADPLVAGSLFGLDAAMTPLLMVIDASPVFRIVDRAYGGTGTAPNPLPETFPMAAELMIGRLDTMIAAQIVSAIAGATDDVVRSGTNRIIPLRRDSRLARLAPFAEDQRLAILAIVVEEVDASMWQLTLALPVIALPAWFGDQPQPRPATPMDRLRRPGSVLDEPMSDIPIALSALVVDMVLPLATVAALFPGQVLPVQVARSIPLRTGGITIAHGTIGAVDENVAIQITSAFTC